MMGDSPFTAGNGMMRATAACAARLDRAPPFFEELEAATFRERLRFLRLVAYVTHRDTMNGWAFARAGLHRLYDAEALAAAAIAGGFAPCGVEVREVAVNRSVRGLLVHARREG